MEGLCQLERPQDAIDLFQQIGTLRQQIDIDNEPSHDIYEQQQQQQQQEETPSKDLHASNIMTTRSVEPMTTLPTTDDDILDNGEQEMVTTITDSDDASLSLDGSSSNRQQKSEMSLQASFQR